MYLHVSLNEFLHPPMNCKYLADWFVSSGDIDSSLINVLYLLACSHFVSLSLGLYDLLDFVSFIRF